MEFITEAYDEANGKAAQGFKTGDRFFVVFGTKQRTEDNRMAFVVSHGKPSRAYGSASAAHNAMTRWVYR